MSSEITHDVPAVAPPRRMRLDEVNFHLADPNTVRSFRIRLAALKGVLVELGQPVPQLNRAINRAFQMVEGPQGSRGRRLTEAKQRRLLRDVVDFWSAGIVRRAETAQ